MIKYNVVICCYGKMLVIGHIYQGFVITTHYYIVFYHFNNS